MSEKLLNNDKVIVNGKILYHVQSLSDYSTEPIDYFIFGVQQPSEKQIRKIVIEDIGKDWVDNFMDNHEVYTVYAEEV